MGYSNQHWRPPISWEDLEFQDDKLVKIRGMRPMYMDGYTLKEALEQVSCLLMRKMLENLPPPVQPFNELPVISQSFTEVKEFRLSPDTDPGGDSNVE